MTHFVRNSHLPEKLVECINQIIICRLFIKSITKHTKQIFPPSSLTVERTRITLELESSTYCCRWWTTLAMGQCRSGTPGSIWFFYHRTSSPPSMGFLFIFYGKITRTHVFPSFPIGNEAAVRSGKDQPIT